nr:hypothetical protein [uncultured Cellulosilyticum sp.]
MAKAVATTEKIDEKAPYTKPEKPKKKKGLIIVLVIILLVGVVGFIFRKPIGTILKDVPIIGSLFKEEEVKVPYNELESRLATSELEATSLRGKVESYEAEIKALEEKIETLKQYETNYNSFLEQKKAWDERIAETNTDLFIQQFEQIYPDTAEEIYSELKGQSIMSKEQKAYANTIGQMDAEQAAKAMEILLTTDPELIQMIFENMGQEQRAAILDNMTSQGAAQTMKLISPDINIVSE